MNEHISWRHGPAELISGLQSWQGCAPRTPLHCLLQRRCFMGSSPPGDLATTATTVVLTALEVQEEPPPLPPPLHLWPPTMPWPWPTPTSISNDCPFVPGKKPGCCCRYLSWWGAVVLVPQRPLCWYCTGIHRGNGVRGCPGEGRFGRIWLRAGVKLRGGLLLYSVCSREFPLLLTQSFQEVCYLVPGDYCYWSIPLVEEAKQCSGARPISCQWFEKPTSAIILSKQSVRTMPESSSERSLSQSGMASSLFLEMACFMRLSMDWWSVLTGNKQ